ncbi:MAG: choline-sulfatase, partial [Gammaproteobacteria bacterium]
MSSHPSPPNILLVQCDQLSALALPSYGHRVVRAPHIDSLAEHGVVFDNAYCNFPICAPSRFSMLSGTLASEIGAFDNGAEFMASQPTLTHYLRARGYRTCLSGKMHFVGPDQLHGFERRVTTDIYPADFYWTPDWGRSGERYAFEKGGGVTGVDSLEDAGVRARTMQLDYDDEVTHRGVRQIYDFARSNENAPFFLTVSFTHPHDPYIATQAYWDRYRHDDIDMPTTAPIPFEDQDPHSQKHHLHIGLDRRTPDEAVVRRVRHGYYAAVSYLDDRLGELLSALQATGLRESTVVLLTSDHGDMLGERGMWFKQTFFEWAMRVPLIVSWPEQFPSRRVSGNVSLIDLLPTLVELAGADSGALIEPMRGHSLMPLLHGDQAGWPDVVYAEHLSDAAYATRVMIRRGRYKYVASSVYPPMLFDLEDDPEELTNLASDPGHAERAASLAQETREIWDLDGLD